MGVCTSTNHNDLFLKKSIQNNNREQSYDNLEPPLCQKELIQGDSPNSEICLLETDELNQNSEKATKEQSQRELVNRIVNVHDSPNSKRYYIVYDQLYNIKHKVPKLQSINQSSLIQKRKSQLL